MSEPIPILDCDTDRDHTLRIAQPTVFVLHTTGTSDEDAVHRYYSRGKISPHAMINREGAIRRYVAEDQIAAHAGLTQAQVKLYRAGAWRKYIEQDGTYARQSADYSGYATWDRRWPGLRSPLELLTGEHPNRVSIGIECLASHREPPDVFTDAQYSALAAYIKEQAERFQIQLTRAHLLGHYDVNPIARCNRRGDADPGERFNYDRLLSLCA